MQDAQASHSRLPDRRKAARRRTFLGGRITVEKLEAFDVECTVRNVSAGGARLALAQPILVPSTFDIGIAGAAGQRGRLVWYRGGELGVVFGEPQAPAAPDAGVAATPSAQPLQARMQAIIARRRAIGTGFTRP